jgi:hypothetical protein
LDADRVCVSILQAIDEMVNGAPVTLVSWPSLMLLGAPCAGRGSELGCGFGTNAHAFVRAEQPGTVYLAIAASAPTVLDVVVLLSAPTAPPLNETCQTAPPLSPEVKQNIDLGGHTDDAKLACLAGAVDAAYALDVTAPSDVLLVTRISSGDVVSTAIALPPCGAASDVITCDNSSTTPLRVGRHNLGPGSYRAVVESQGAANVELEALLRPATLPTLVAFADTCAQAVDIPLAGGFFQGNTANANADYPAGCDFGGAGGNGAPEQLLRLVLPSQKRVVFDMRGSSFATLLNVRKGPSCPGTELPQACAAGYSILRSYLDLTLDAGSYFVQVDGYAGASGPWMLDAPVLEP